MRKTKSFKAGEEVDAIGQFAKNSANELTGSTGCQSIAARVRVTVETMKNCLSVDPLLEELRLDGVRDVVEEYLSHRSDELRKPVRSIRALKRLLRPFAGRPAALRIAVQETCRHGWTGIFEKQDSDNCRIPKEMERKDDGGAW